MLQMERSKLPSVLLPGVELLEKVDEGGSAEIFLARQLNPDRQVVVKILRNLPENLRSANECQLMASLRHPNIVEIYDCIEIEESRCLILELVHAPNLRTWMNSRKQWPVSQALTILGGIASALSYLHQKEFLHLDLKPENVLVDEKLEIVKLTDFGLSMPKHQATVGMALTEAQGSLDYAPPEQRFGLPLDERADIYAFAKLTYELLTSHLPGRRFISVTKRTETLPGTIDEVLMSGLSRYLEHRPHSVNEFFTALRDAIPPRLDK